jgi:amino acid adenylation domain-containing protein
MNAETFEDSYPLSPMQQGMLFHTLYSPPSRVYIRQFVCALHEDLNVPAFKQAWQRVVERHPILRTVFRWKGLDEPRQHVHRRVIVPWEERDWRSSSAREQEERLKGYLEVDRRRGFELDEAPLMRLALFRMDETDYRLIWTSHHVSFDGRSRHLLLKEIFAFYEAFCRGRDLQPERSRPYGDYIEWLGKQDLTRAEGFWRRTLDGVTAATPLTADRARRADADEEDFGKQEIRLSKTLTSALHSLARSHQITPNTLLMGVWALLLSRYSGEEDVVFGATRSTRHTTLEEAEAMVGLLINTLPVRVRVCAQMPLLTWLKELRAQWIAARPYEHTPLLKVHEWSEIPAGRPLFESILIFENYSLNSVLRAQGGWWEKREFRLLGGNPYPLTVAGYLDAELELEIAYDRSRFDDNTVARMLGHLRTLLEAVVANPERRLSDLPLLTEAERHRLLAEWNDTKRNDRKDKCIHELFEEQAERTPDAVAAVFEDERLTYRELNRRANQLAHYLKKLGVGPEALVGLCVERSLEMIVGLLAILKAGAAYVPLDASCPNQRLEFMLRDTSMAVLLTQQRLVDGLPHDGMHTICLDADRHAIAPQSDSNPISCAKPENLAYVIYTSGSTGMPKGVLIEHRQILNYVHGISERLNLAPGAGFAMVQPLSADSSQTVIFPSLISGGCLHVISEDRASDPRALSEYFSRFPIDLLKIAPSHLAALQISSRPEQLLPRRWLVVGGEVSRWDWMDRLQATASCSIFNHYGPTEATVGVLTYAVQKNQNARSSSTVPIGRPLPNTRAFLLDRHMQPVPIGASGELHIGGDGLARGYLNRPELTAEKFVSNPFSDDPQARLYKTGDLARYLPDGNIEFLGRIDDQVKIRGFRVEPGEIEAILGQHPGVRESVVIAREDSAGKHLAAYVVPRESETPAIGDLRSFLRAKLPEYMVPSAFLMLDALPRTPHGKVDRHALPPPNHSGPGPDETLVEPRNPVEKALVKIWSQVLGLERVGVHDNFFDLGGHSLLATQVISRARELYRIEISLRTFFETPTIAGIAEVIERAKDSDAESAAPKISPVSRQARRVKAPL